MYTHIHTHQVSLVVKSLPANTLDLRDSGSIFGLGRSSGGGHGNPLQYSCLENPMDTGAWWAIVHRLAKSWTWSKQLSTQLPFLPPGDLSNPEIDPVSLGSYCIGRQILYHWATQEAYIYIGMIYTHLYIRMIYTHLYYLQLFLIFHRFHISKFTSVLKFICNPN